MRLADWMRSEGLTDEAVAAAVGLSAETIRKLRFRARGASIRTAARIDEVSRGAVRPADLVPSKRRTPSVPPKARP